MVPTVSISRNNSGGWSIIHDGRDITGVDRAEGGYPMSATCCPQFTYC